MLDDERSGFDFLRELAFLGDGEEDGAGLLDGDGLVGAGGEVVADAAGDGAEHAGDVGGELAHVVEGEDVVLLGLALEARRCFGELGEGGGVGIDQIAESRGGVGFTAGGGALDDEDG